MKTNQNSQVSYTLKFDDYAWPSDLTSVPEEAGIYCMYSIKLVNGEKRINRLEYVGKALNLKQRIQKHCRKPALDKDGRPIDPKTSPSEYLYNHDDPMAECLYIYAKLDGRSIETCEASMIKQFKPEINTKYLDTLGCHQPAQITVSGKYIYRPIAKGTYEVDEDK